MNRASLRAPGLTLLAWLALGCGRSDGRERLVVFAAASLREPLTALAADFEREHSGVVIAFNFAGSQELGRQIEQGAAADVFASADERHLSALERAALGSEPQVFVRNELALVVSKSSSASVRGISDLPAVSRVVIGAAEVPVGRYTLALLERAGEAYGADFRARVEAKVVSRELNVRQVLSRVLLGEADAGVVYRSDALSAGGQVTVVEIPPELNVIAEYPLAVMARSERPELGRAWVAHLLSPRGQAALQRAGFRPGAERP